jgi:squalene-associated FAD-dependent desaturase
VKVAIIGAGWAGCAAAVEATRLGHQVTVFEAARIPGGRARRVPAGDAQPPLDNGQHILIGAYTDTLQLMADVGVDLATTLRRLPLALQGPDGQGLKLPRCRAPLDAVLGIALARGWSWGDKLSLLRMAARWQLAGFACPPQQTVADLCCALSPRVVAQLIEPLCVSALNTPASRASGQVFLRVLQDSMFAARGGSNLLLPMVDLSALLPDAALAWLTQHGGAVQLGTRVQHIEALDRGWQVTAGSTLAFDQVVLACPPSEAARLVAGSGVQADDWLSTTRALRFEAITTVYAHGSGARLPQPMLALSSSALEPAQFVFDRGQLGGPTGLLAFVISASEGDSAALTERVLAQAARQLGAARGCAALLSVQTIVEKRATFACTAGLLRPGAVLAPRLWACGDYVDGPYPATLEGAVRSGLRVARGL